MKIFYSWQSDKHIPNNLNRSFIEKALENAAKAIRKDESIEVVPVVDRDTFGIAGTPSIPQTILQKIDEADVFVCDITIVNSSKKFRPTPNPNVLFELGYAVHKLGWEKIVMIMNEAFGSIEKLPFDLEKRRTIIYNLNESEIDKASVRNVLEKRIESQLRLIAEIDNRKELDSERVEDKTDSFLVQAQNLAKEVERKKFRNNWFYTQQGVVDTLNSANEIFASIDEKFMQNAETFNHLGITLSKDKFLRSVQTLKFGSQVELKNYDRWQNMSSLSDVWLLLVFYKKNPLYNGMFTTDAIEQIYFVPDVNNEQKMVWKNKQNEADTFTANQLSEKCFENLIKKITEKKLDETVPGGRYFVNGKFVNANGELIE